jgi:hypothetical protein
LILHFDADDRLNERAGQVVPLLEAETALSAPADDTMPDEIGRFLEQWQMPNIKWHMENSLPSRFRDLLTAPRA